MRDVLLVTQIAICAVLVTASMVAVRGLLQSMHSNFGFDPENAMLVDSNLTMAGYEGGRVTAMQRRMIDSVAAIPGVEAVGLVDQVPLGGNFGSSDIYRDQTPANVVADVMTFRISPDYFRAAGSALVAGRTFSWHDDASTPRVAVINREFARRIFGSESNALGNHFKMGSGARIEVVGIQENGKYYQLTEKLRPAFFLPMLQSPSANTSLIVRSRREPQPLAAAIRMTLHGVDEGLPIQVNTWTEELSVALFPSRVATMSLGVLGGMGAILAITGIFGMAANSVSKRLRELGIRMALGAQRRELLQAALGRALASRLLAYIVYQANPRDPLVLLGVVVAMLIMGLVATWIPAQRALSVDPLILLREE
jgi:predicted permease